MSGSKKSIRDILDGLKSEKIKERNESVQAVRSHFSTEWHPARETDTKMWSLLFKAIFKSVEIERLALRKARERTTKGGSSEATVTKRLVEVGKAIRLVVEKAAVFLNHKEVANVLSGLFLLQEFHRDLFPHVGLDYLKALKHIASYRPHLDHLKEAEWAKFVQICFNVILGDPLNTPLSNGGEDCDDEMDVDDGGSDEDGDEDLPSTQNPKKRTAATQGGGRIFPSKRRRQQISVTAEQVECASMLSILLQSTNSPIASPPIRDADEDDCGYLPAAILDNLYRILATYPGESSILYDYLEAVSLALNRIAFNAIKDVRTFAHRTWNNFIQLLDVKDKRIKERVLIVIRHLFPFMPLPKEVAVPGSYHSTQTILTSDALGDLWDKLDKECDNKWGVDALNLDSLRLELVADDVTSEEISGNPFVASTFRAGWNFDASQALSWAAIELQADCGRELYTLSEVGTPRAKGKRSARFQNPVASLLNTVYAHPLTHHRRYHLQVLLFFIDRHWEVLHDAIKHDIVNTLLQFVNLDDTEVQPWIFLNLAAVAYAEKRCLESNPDLLKPSQQIEVLGPQTWDAVWTHAVKRSNTPGVLCRAACHAAHTLLVSLFRFTAPSGHVFLTTQQVIQDIESFGKDLDFQGPSYPYDSVCMFLTKCLQIASQDVRLYRTQLQDKVSKWLSDSWTVAGATRDTVILNTVSDVLVLLQTIAGLSKQTDLYCRFSLPLSPIVETMRMEKRMKIIQDYLLSASLPTCVQGERSQVPGAAFGAVGQPVDLDPAQLTPPSNEIRLEARPRERKISTFFTRTLDTLLTEWKSRITSTSHIPVEAARQTLDFAVIALTFECSLTVNSTLPNSRVLKTAGELLSSIVVHTKESRWTLPEKLTILLGLESIISATGPMAEGPWEAITPSDYDNDGMARQERPHHHQSSQELTQRKRNALLRALWQSNDLQNPFKILTEAIRVVIDAASDSPIASAQSLDLDDQDGFGPIRTSVASAATQDGMQVSGLLLQLYEIYIPILTRGPLLQSSSGQPTRDRLLLERVTKAAEPNPEWFVMVAPLVLREIESGALECNFNQAAQLYGALGTDVLPLYQFSRDPRAADLTVQLVQSTSNLWSSAGSISDPAASIRAKKLVSWLGQNCERGLMRAWQTRDKFTQFLEKYVRSDPEGSVWREVEKMSKTPIELLASLTTDPDIRVRFRTAVVIPRVLVASRMYGGNLVGTYTTKINTALPTDTNVYEKMVTRLLTVANVMVVSSAVRRGAFWNLLEICRENAIYSIHIQHALEAVVERLGLPTVVSLFEAYAFQLSISMARSNIALWEFPPSLFGFKDRLSCITSAFRAYIPAYIMCEQLETLETHCKNLNKDPRLAQRECFGDAVGFFVGGWYDVHQGEDDAEIEQQLSQLLFDSTTLQTDITGNVDGVVSAILQTLGDQDTSMEGPIVDALNRHDTSGVCAQVFARLVRHRQLYPFETHEPNLPKYSSNSVVKALSWLTAKAPETFDKATIYHVFHALFACIEQTPLVNEKYRLLNALCMWIALTHKVIAKAPNLLHTLVHGATSLLGQHVLARSAQSILEWTFRTYRNAKLSDSRLSPILVRICGIAHDYSKSMQGPLSRLGVDLSVWIDDQAFALCQVKAITERVMNALPAWARDPTGSLAALAVDINWSNVEKIFKDEHGGPNKFRVVRRLKDYLSNKTPAFQREVFWRLKESIPTTEKLHEEDIIAFTDLLLDNHGRIDSLSAEQPDREIESIRMRHRRATKKAQPSQPHEVVMITEARNSIIYGLLVLLENESPALVNIAYRTLRLVLAALPTEPSKSNSWQPVHREELRLLQAYPRPRLSRHTRDLSVLRSEQYVENAAKFSVWVTHLAELIADILASEDELASFGQFHPVLSTDVATAEQALPVLILALLTHERRKVPPEAECRTALSEFFNDVLLFPGTCLPVVKCIVETMIHLRHFQMKPGKGLAILSSERWLSIDFVLLAKSAVRCGAYTTALLFLELAVDQGHPPSSDSATTEQIQYEIYSHIDEPDGFYGIKTTNPTHFLVQRLHHEKQWDKAFRFHGAMIEAQPTGPASSSTYGLLESFSAFGFNTLAMQTLQQADSRTVSNDRAGTAMSYKLGWRSETWDLPDREAYHPGAPLYNALRSMYRERDPKAIDAQLRRSFYREVNQLRSLGIESVAEIKDTLQSMMCLDQILRWRKATTTSGDGSGVALPQWSDFQTVSPQFEFADLENIMSTRISLVRSVRQRETQRHQIGDITSPSIERFLKMEQQCLLTLSTAARETGQTQIALNSIIKAQNLGANPEVSQEYANVLWSLNEPKLAVNHLSDMLKSSQASHIHTPTLLARLGTWTSEACLEKPANIWQKYFVPAQRGLEDDAAAHASEVTKVYHQCAEFAEKQYHSINKSPDMIRRRVYIQRKREEIKERDKQIKVSQSGGGSGPNLYKELKKAQDHAEKLLKDDEKYHKSLRSARDVFLKQALSLYSRCLSLSELFDDEAPIKFSSLWFANFDDEVVDEATIQPALESIPSRKFIFLSHQITARMTTKPPTNQRLNQESLKRLIVRLCREHPFHSLYQVYCLRADTVAVTFPPPLLSNPPGNPSSRTDRSDAADEVLSLLRDDETVGFRVRDVEKACEAYLQWAKFPAKDDAQVSAKGAPIRIRNGMQILALSRLKIPVLTAETKVDPSMKYEDCVFLRNYKRTYETAGGMNLPKISVCVDEQNQEYKQLFKGNDDMRQDAVMEQVFELVNRLLYADRETRRRSLRVRGYKVVPLGTQAGVLEFVPDTQPLRNWLIDAHRDYRPQDIDIWKVAGGMIANAKPKRTSERIRVFKQVCEQVKPVFRHYFTEKHKAPLAWFAMRLRYTRSVATTSIVGYILGLGDRHTSNILLHKEGEVVHIDLGIAFDQGKLLPVPETVPFRLTRDMVDGMGVAGTQGVFQRCSEETLRVLREGSDIIMSVLEVFKHDPLHSWTASEIKIKRAQEEEVGDKKQKHDVPVTPAELHGIGIDMNSGTAEEAADRALSSVERKLDKSLSVDTAVNVLIAEATDIQNLAVIFSGWMPQM